MDHGSDEALRRLAEAGRLGDVAAIEGVLAADVVAVCDSGGLIPALAEPVCGVEDVSRLLAALLGGCGDAEVTVEAVNGGSGLAVRRGGRAVAVLAVPTATADPPTGPRADRMADRRMAVLWIVLNPAKLGRWHHDRYRAGQSRAVGL